eukprot:Gb_33348 [translate_table: standard]
MVPPPDPGGHGKAFIMAPYKSLMGVLAAEYLGLLNISSNGQPCKHLFCIGVNGNNGREFQKLILKSGQNIQVWIDYDRFQNQFTLRITLAGLRDEEVLGSGKVYKGVLPSSGLHVGNDIRNPKIILQWAQRYTILKDVAAGLLYLHEEWEQRVIHRDIKSSNVLLDSEFNVRLGNFGLACLYDPSENPQTNHVIGTLGYIAPQLAHTGKAPSADVFCFDVGGCVWKKTCRSVKACSSFNGLGMGIACQGEADGITIK